LLSSLEVVSTRYAAGETVVGAVRRAGFPAAVALLRLETRPCGRAAVLVAKTTPEHTTGRFELALPSSALPTAAAERCAIAYLVQARAGATIARAAIDVSADARPHLAGAGARHEPLVAAWDARHFHLELVDADLRGGGRIAGRLHHDGGLRSSRVAVSACCAESWRPKGPAARGMPYWPARMLWRETVEVVLDADSTWAPFEFRLPGALPPAVEARTFAWRYELRARRHARYRWPDETAALTPLLYEEGR
jgi:hypothetical protein